MIFCVLVCPSGQPHIYSRMRDTKDIINEVLAAWSIEFIQNRLKAAQAIPEASGRGKTSFRRDIVRASTNDLARVLFEFEGYLRLQDMRKLKWSKQPPFQEILQYVKDKGVNKFINGFSRKHKIPTSNVRLMNQIAWGIVKSKQKTSKRKRIKWYNKSKERDIHSLYGRLLAAIRENQMDSIKKTLQAA